MAMTKRARFESSCPGVFFLDEHNLDGLKVYLQDQEWLTGEESLLSASKPGEGNMNYTLRVETSTRRMILKQARPWVEKYDDIAAPSERAIVEGRFYQLIEHIPALQARMPRLLGFDPASRLLMLEDVGVGSDYTGLYTGEALTSEELETLVNFLSTLHASSLGFNQDGRFNNQVMRQLNHEHIFRVPLDPANGLDLDSITPGLSESAVELSKDNDYVNAVSELGKLYLQTGNFLLHGDFFPGSWLHSANGPRIIDPEFCFFGPPEFDFGVLIGHLHLSNQPAELIDRTLQAYSASCSNLRKSTKLLQQFAGVEIMRRLIGVAQLPISADLGRKQALLTQSRRLVCS
tara:strand:- start:598 stop:1638 length:1041 start_codon:yes stop_codon:yes gene_type:complete